MALGEATFVVILYAFAAVGMAGVWLVPARLWAVVITRRIGRPLVLRPASAIAATLVIAALLFSLWIGSDTLPRVFRCLADNQAHCSANRAGGLIALATFGVAAAVVEVTWIVAQLLVGWCSERATRLPGR